MRDETKLIHSGYKSDPTTKSVAVPIYQTVAYEFDSAQHGADLFDNLENILLPVPKYLAEGPHFGSEATTFYFF